MRNLRGRVLLIAGATFLCVFAPPPSALGQATLTGAQLRGVVQDPSQAAVPGATVTVTNDATQVSEKASTDEAGRYIFNRLQPATYTVRVEAPGFKTIVWSNVVLRVGQQTDLDFTVDIGAVATTVEVAGGAPLLNSVSASLGQEVDNRYVTEMPLLDRQFYRLAFLAPGVTEIGDTLFGNDLSISGVNYVSNGQRVATTEVRLDGALMAGTEGGEGGMFRVQYAPSIEIIQEFKLVNNSHSAEYGNNGGSVMLMVTKSGTNEFHGSGYWFGRRPELDANNFFSNRAGEKKTDFKRDQYGGSIGGPIVRQKTFFFFDYDRVRFAAPGTLTTTVPTALQKQGDFSQTLNPDGTLMQLFNPFDTYVDANGNVKRRPFGGNAIPALLMDPVAVNLMSFYPEPTGPGDPVTGFNNFTKSGTSSNPAWQFDIKVDHNISEKSRLSGRYSRGFRGGRPPRFYGNPADDAFVDDNRTNNAVIEHTYTFSPTTVWGNRAALERFIERRATPDFDPTSIGFPSVLREGGKDLFPRIDVTNYGSLGPFFCNDVVEAHTVPHYASSISKVVGPHNLKFGGEQRINLTNFWQPCIPAGYFVFDPSTTAEAVFSPSSLQGNALASLLLGWPVGDRMVIQPGTATKSKETAFYFQNDWKVTQRLTVNLGLRYEWSSPYTERFDRIQIADFDADTGVDVSGLGRLRGVNQFVDANRRTVDSDRNNFAPRLGLAYRLGQKTVLRGGAGLYYGVSPATNHWLTGSAFIGSSPIISSLDGGITPFGSLSNPFPNGLNYPQGRRYGDLNMWGLSSNSHTDEDFRNAEIYQWNVGIQHELPGSILVEVAYSASRSVHLPFMYAQNYNFVSRANRENYGTAGLYELVPNPFQPLFCSTYDATQGRCLAPGTVFDEPGSVYNNPEITRINLLRPFPQFDSGFTGFPPPIGKARYNALQMRVEKRYSHGLHFLGSYTFSRMMDDSTGFNAWLGGISGWGIQDPTNLRDEWSVGPADTPHRMVFSWGYELPVGRGKRLGNQMNRALNAVVGNWQVNGFLTLQSGTPLYIGLANPLLADGVQRPNLNGNSRTGFSIKEVVDGKGTMFNPSAFSEPGDQLTGNSPRYNADLRGNGIRNLDLSIFKRFPFREDMELQLRAEFFNFTNTPRFASPDTYFGSPTFGTINSQVNRARQAQMGIRFVF